MDCKALRILTIIAIIMNLPCSIGDRIIHANGICDPNLGYVSLNFRSVGLRRIDSDFASSLNATCLNLENNEITYVSPTAFRQMPHLFYLNLAGNNISLTNFTSLDSHSNVYTLILDENESVGNEILEFKNKFEQLAYLYLRSNGIKDITSLSFAPRIMSLYLGSNNLEEGELSFLGDVSRTLTTVELVNNRLKNFNTVNLTSLRELLLDDNRFENICGNDSSECQESSLILQGAIRLRRLSLIRNQLSTIKSTAFDSAVNLLDLNLSSNNIRDIDTNAFEKLKLLQNLTLNDNALTEIPSLCGIKYLQHLSIVNNQLNILRNNTFCDINNLRIVDFSRNNISSLESGTFAHQIRLEILNLSNNLLSTLPNSWLTNLTSLRILYLEGNQLTSLSDVALSGARYYSSLEYVFLKNNLINKIYTRSFYNAFRNIRNVTIELYDINNGTDGNFNINLDKSEECNCKCNETNEV